MTDQRSATDVVLDNLIYAPLGLVGEARRLVPELAERGRMQVANARFVGKFAVQFGQAEAAKRVGGIESQVRGILAGFGLTGPEVTASVPATSRDRPSTSDSAAASSSLPQSRVDAPAVDSLAIPDYDSLAASQVVSRLAGLRPNELGDVQAYELANRGRKTILGKIAQLQAS